CVQHLPRKAWEILQRYAKATSEAGITSVVISKNVLDGRNATLDRNVVLGLAELPLERVAFECGYTQSLGDLFDEHIPRDIQFDEFPAQGENDASARTDLSNDEGAAPKSVNAEFRRRRALREPVVVVAASLLFDAEVSQKNVD